MGSTLGGILGRVYTYKYKRAGFCDDGAFVVIFLDQWLSSKEHRPAVVGIAVTAVCLKIFGADNFIIPSMLFIVEMLTLFRNKLEEKGERL